VSLRIDFSPDVISDLESCFATEEICHDFLFRLRWPRGFACPRCECVKGWAVRGGLYECGYCKYQVSVTSGTILQNTRVPLKIWFKAIWWLVGQKNAASPMELKRSLGLGSYKTAWTMLERLRQAMTQPDSPNLRGITEVSQIFLPESNGLPNSRETDKGIFVAVVAQIHELDIEQIRMSRLADSSSSAFGAFLKDTVKPGSVIRTNDSENFEGLDQHVYQHERFLESINEYDGAHLLPHVRDVVTLFDRWLAGTSIRNNPHQRFDCYLDEFVFRFNATRAESPFEFFYKILLNVSQTKLASAAQHKIKVNAASGR